MTAKTASVWNWRVRYAAAPSWTAAAISCIFVGALVGGEHLAAQSARRRRARRARSTATTTTIGEVAAGQVERPPLGGEGEPGHCVLLDEPIREPAAVAGGAAGRVARATERRLAGRPRQPSRRTSGATSARPESTQR